MASARQMRRALRAVGRVSFLLILTGCAGSGVTTSVSTDAGNPRAEDLARLESADARERLLFEVDRWLGSEYQWGGTDRSGFDCSGFVRRVYRDAFDTDLPRTTRQQVRVGSGVGRKDLQLADLVFFRTGSRTDHVGIYLGDGEFAHASSSSGVMISHLGERYWSNAYSTGRRILNLDVSKSSTRPASNEAGPPRVPAGERGGDRLTSARVGW